MLFEKLKSVFEQYKYAMSLVWSSSRSLTVSRIVTIFFLAILPLAQLYLMKLVIDELTAGGAMDKSKIDQTVLYLIIMGVIQLLNGASQSLAQYIDALQQQKVSDHMARLLQEKSLAIDFGFYDDPAYHDSLSLAQKHGLYKPSQIVISLMTFVQNLIQLVVIGGFILLLHEFVALLLFVAVIPSAFIKYFFADKFFKWEKNRVAIERESRYLSQIVTLEEHAKEVRVFDSGAYFSSRFQKIRDQLFKEKKSLNGLLARIGIGGQAIEITAEISSYIFVAYRFVHGHVTIGDLVIYFQAFQRGKTNLTAALKAMVNLMEHRMYLTNVTDFMGITPKITEDPDASGAEEPIQIGIQLVDVSFKYPKSQEFAVKEVSLDFPLGKITAIVGENGSGKSTLVKLVARLYDPTSGQINLDGVNYKAIRLSHLREKMSITFQDFGKYFLSIKENIRISDIGKEHTDKEVRTFAKLSGAADFIEQLPNRYDQSLGKMFKDGTELSAGQWQKLALSRMLFKEAEVLIVDEPTSAIDPLAEHRIFEELRKLAKTKVVILITHRLYNLKSADQIVVMDHGQVVETGTHHDLIAKPGKYAEMLQKQL